MLTAIRLILNDDQKNSLPADVDVPVCGEATKKTERHRTVDKNILFQDSVYLFSFEQSNCVRAAYSRILSSCCFDLF